MKDIDAVAIMAEHLDLRVIMIAHEQHTNPVGSFTRCTRRESDDQDHCLPYRLAAENARAMEVWERDQRFIRLIQAEMFALAAQVEAVRAALQGALHDRHAAELNGLIADCAGCVAEHALAALATEGAEQSGARISHEPFSDAARVALVAATSVPSSVVAVYPEGAE